MFARKWSDYINSVSDFTEEQKWFDVQSPRWGRLSMFPLNEINAKDSGFLVNGELKIVAEIEVLEVIGKLDVSEETSTIMESMDFNGFQLLPSQVKIKNATNVLCRIYSTTRDNMMCSIFMDSIL